MFIDMNGMVLSLAEKEDGTTKRSYQTTVAIEGILDSPLTIGLMSCGSQIFSDQIRAYVTKIQKSVEVVERKLSIEGRRHDLEHIIY